MELKKWDAGWQEPPNPMGSEGYVLSVIDSEGRYIYTNQGWQNFNQKNEPIGLHYSDVLPGSKISEVIKTGTPKYGYYNGGGVESKGFFAAYIPIYEDGRVKKIAIFSIPGASLQMHERASQALLATRYTVSSIIGTSELCQNLRGQIKKYAPAFAPVVIEGETGTGKELIAQSLHSENGRGGPFVSVNCASIPESLFEAEFFGYVEGSFTGARRGGHAGLLESAQNGTLFLDEISHLSLHFQAKLLRALQEQQIVRVGGVEPIRINARIVCATNRSLKQMVKEGTFREDLYFRLNVLYIHAPALRERPEDIPLLARSFLQHYSGVYGVMPPRMDDSAIRFLKEYPWPGNVRELQNIIERIIVCHCDSAVTLKDQHFAEYLNEPCAEHKSTRVAPMEATVASQVTLTALRELFAAEERNLLIRTMEECDGNKSLAAKILDISRTQLYNKLKEYGIED